MHRTWLRFAGVALSLGFTLTLTLAACGRTPPPTASAKAPTAAPSNGGSAAGASTVSEACTAADVRGRRKLAQARLDAGKPAEAVELLQGTRCHLSPDQPPELQREIAWLISDRSFAEYRAGNLEGCYATAAAQTAAYAGNVAAQFEGDTPVMKALEHNANLCRAAVEKKRGSFTASTPCPMDPDGVGVPAALLDKGDSAACLLFGAQGKDADGISVCRKVELLRRTQAGKVVRTALQVAEGNLVDGGVCCNISSTAFTKRATGWAALITSEGRNCDGGTASSAEEHVYELSGTTLTISHKLDVGYH